MRRLSTRIVQGNGENFVTTGATVTVHATGVVQGMRMPPHIVAPSIFRTGRTGIIPVFPLL